MNPKDRDMRKPKVDIYQGVDGAWVVHVDTDEEGKCNETGPFPLRVYINDGEAVYENPPYPMGWADVD